MTSFMFHHFSNPDAEFPYQNIRFRHYESRFMDELLANARDPLEREKGSVGVNMSREVVLIKGSGEIEGRYIEYVPRLTGKRFVPVDPLVQEPDENFSSSELLSWLEQKEAKSTVFVSFGNEYFLSKEDMDGIAHGLLQSRDCSWAPQTRIPVHPNVGGFVSHCGWNSVMESFKFGVPIVAVPMHLDQPINARLVEEIGAWKEVLRDRDGRLNAETVAEVINRVVVEDGVRAKVDDVKKKLALKGDGEIDEVARELMSICSKSLIN
ncbi:hypothetical protein SASPL_153313 [Salvia splendens]|uniref:Uncharacterized protein n=1 Tax=Salvia splendens TaxID=180675 RepID=A0A8X8W4U1_SALSN|nr:hypothetical protein SASPL_153313 [Salvia splendens]